MGQVIPQRTDIYQVLNTGTITAHTEVSGIPYCTYNIKRKLCQTTLRKKSFWVMLLYVVTSRHRRKTQLQIRDIKERLLSIMLNWFLLKMNSTFQYAQFWTSKKRNWLPFWQFHQFHLGGHRTLWFPAIVLYDIKSWKTKVIIQKQQLTVRHV